MWLTLEGETGATTRLGVTSEHPMFVAGLGWTAAGEVAPGDTIRNADLAELRVLAVAADTLPTRVHNLEIASAHTYFAGELEAWGHNSTAPSLPPTRVAPNITHNFGNACPLPGTPVEHPPVHVNFTFGGKTYRLGGNGKPILNDPPLPRNVAKAVACQKGLIRRTVNKIQRWYKWHQN